MIRQKKLYDLGIAELTTPGGNIVRTFSLGRTLCDILRLRSRVDIQVVAEEFKCYAIRSDKKISIFTEYAKILKVETRLRSYLEVLL